MQGSEQREQCDRRLLPPTGQDERRIKAWLQWSQEER